MFQLKQKYQFCEVFGIPITADISSLGLLLLLVFDFGLPLGLPCAIMLALSIVLHELAHSLTSKAFGCRISEIRLSLLGGCASGEIPHAAWKELLMAAAGPAMSFLIGFGLLFALGGVSIESDWLRTVLQYAIIMNIMLGAFNLLPGFPMDGGRIFRSVMRVFMTRAKATFVAAWVGRAFAILLALRGVHSIFTNGGWGFISLLIAWMIWQEGMREYRQALQDENWTRWTQDDFNARVSPPPYDR